jgi:hypothetical protein
VKSLADLQTERAFQEAVVRFAKLQGWLVMHQWSSLHSPAGFPDLVLVRPPFVVYAELKRCNKYPTDAQQEWLDALERCGEEAYVWHPCEWPQIEARLGRTP